MPITTGQIFNIGTIVLGAAFGVWAILDPTRSQTIGALGAIIIPAWGGVGIALTKPSDQTAAVVSNIDNPAVKAKIVQAVANLQGVKAVDVDLAKADQSLANLAISTAPENAKITRS